MRAIKIILVILVILSGVFLLGPQVSYDPLPSPEIELSEVRIEQLDDYVALKESEYPNIRQGNEAIIYWADSAKTRTRYAMVYLHGFSASREEGNPVHLNVARKFGFNLYLPRLANHGLEGEESMTDLSPNGLIESAKEAIAIGQLLGEDVIVMSTSTGGTLSIYLAGANPEIIDAMILFSPNIEIADQSAKILTMPWGLQLGKIIAGDFRSFEGDSLVDQYWTSKYRIEAIAALQKLLDETMHEDVFEKVTQPYFLGYYYKNDTAQDRTVSVEAIRRFDSKTSTPPDKKRVVAFPEVGEHVIASYITSKDLESVEKEVSDFMTEVLSLQPTRSLDTLLTQNF